MSDRPRSRSSPTAPAAAIPGPGGWGAILRYGGREGDLRRRAADHQQPHGADGRDRGAGGAEAALPGRALHRQPVSAQRHHEWLHGWKARGWRTADKKPVKNVDLWQRLDEAAAQHEVEWHWVRGHAGHPENERADALARAAIVRKKNHNNQYITSVQDSTDIRRSARRRPAGCTGLTRPTRYARRRFLPVSRRTRRRPCAARSCCRRSARPHRASRAGRARDEWR